MRISIGDLRRAIKTGVLREDKQRETGTSVDAQIDKYLNEYLRGAIDVKNEHVDLRQMTKDFFVIQEEAATKHSADDIDVDAFVEKVANLIDNYDNLLEIRDTVVKRAKNFLAETCDDSVLRQYDDTLRETHGIVAGETHQETEDSKFTAPAGANAGPSLSTGGGGP